MQHTPRFPLPQRCVFWVLVLEGPSADDIAHGDMDTFITMLADCGGLTAVRWRSDRPRSMWEFSSEPDLRRFIDYLADTFWIPTTDNLHLVWSAALEVAV